MQISALKGIQIVALLLLIANSVHCTRWITVSDCQVNTGNQVRSSQKWMELENDSLQKVVQKTGMVITQQIYQIRRTVF